MNARADRENYGPQIEAIEEARQKVRDSLEDLIDSAKNALRAANTKAFNPDILKVHSDWLAVDRSNDDVAIALTDLATAKGEGI